MSSALELLPVQGTECKLFSHPSIVKHCMVNEKVLTIAVKSNMEN
jgi:hypothetical protein